MVVRDISGRVAGDQGVDRLRVERCSAALAADETTVTLTTSALSTGVTYTLTVNGVRDQASTPNKIASDTTIDFEFLNVVTTGIRISSGGGDVEESEDGTVTSSSSDLEMADNGADNQTIGLRFSPVEIPQGRPPGTR